MQAVEPMREIDIVAAKSALGQNERDLGREIRAPCGRRVGHHAGEPRRQRQLAQPPALGGDAPFSINRANVLQQRLRLFDRRLRRGIEERERCRIGDTPVREIEHKAAEIGGENLRRVACVERRGLRLIPQPIADAGFGAPGASATLIRRCARYAHGHQPGEPHIGLIPRNAREAAVDDNADAFNRQRGLGNRRGQHDLAAAGRRRRDRAVLHLGIERAIECDDIDRRIGDALAQQCLGPADFSGTGQENEQRSGIRSQRPHHGVGDLTFDMGLRIAPKVPGLDRKRPAGAFDHRCAAEQIADAGAVECRRHHQQFQVFAQALLNIPRQRQSKVRIQRTLVELIEQQRRDAIERRVVQHHAGENAFGNHLDAGLR